MAPAIKTGSAEAFREQQIAMAQRNATPSAASQETNMRNLAMAQKAAPKAQRNPFSRSGMAKKGMNKGGMANCGASMKPAQGRGK